MQQSEIWAKGSKHCSLVLWLAQCKMWEHAQNPGCSKAARCATGEHHQKHLGLRVPLISNYILKLCFARVCTMCNSGAWGGQKWAWVRLSWSYGWLWSTNCLLMAEPGSSVGATEAIAPATSSFWLLCFQKSLSVLSPPPCPTPTSAFSDSLVGLSHCFGRGSGTEAQEWGGS